MNCNIYVILGTVSIILIIGITILIYYKNMKDNKINSKNNNIIEQFYPIDDKIISNNNLINSLMQQLTSIGIYPSVNNNPTDINDQLQAKISTSINSDVGTIIANYSTNNDINKVNIDLLENKVIDLENIINNKKLGNLNSTKYNRIKSLNNGMEIDLFNTSNTLFQDKNTGKITDACLVGVNNGCISVGANNYDVYKCNDKNIKQMFKLQHIINETDYANNIDKSVPFDNVDKSSISYPFAMIKSVNNDNCLTNNHGSLTVQPCYSFVAQRWMPLL